MYLSSGSNTSEGLNAKKFLMSEKEEKNLAENRLLK